MTIYESAEPLSPANRIDEFVFERLKRLGIQPATLCSDAVFLRRAYIDLTGTLPAASEAAAFLADQNPDRRAALVDRLLGRPEFADYQALRWSDVLRIKAEFPINLWPEAAQSYHHWIRASIAENKPCDRLARELLTASGSNFRVPPVNFFRAIQNRDAQSIAKAVALAFMGTRTPPAEIAAPFAGLRYKATSEWKEEIVYFEGRDTRPAFADWLTAPSNPWFARSIVNRVWYWLLGRGIVQEPDDIRPDNPPSNPELLAYLYRELTDSRYDLKKLYRLILNSRTWQLSSIPRSTHPAAAANFASYPLRRLDAEVLADALCQVTGTGETYTSAIPEPFTYMPPDQRAIALPDGSITSPFLELFGRPPRDTGLESERNNRPSAAQRLHFLNSSHVQQKLRQVRFADAKTAYLTILSRYPSEAELKLAAGSPDLAWALLNTLEFQYRH